MRCAVPPNWRQSYFILSQAALPNWRQSCFIKIQATLPNWQCVLYVSNDKTGCIFHLVVHAKRYNKSNVFIFRLIVGFIQKFQSQLQQDLVDLSLLNAFSITKLDSISIKAKANSAKIIDMPTSQQRAMIHFNNGSFQFIVKFIYSPDSEGAHTAISCYETTFQALKFIVGSTSIADFQLIVNLFLIGSTCSAYLTFLIFQGRLGAMCKYR